MGGDILSIRKISGSNGCKSANGTVPIPKTGTTIRCFTDATAFLAEAVGRLDSVFGSLRYQDVTAPKMIEAVVGVTC
jgi:hypothetical protein